MMTTTNTMTFSFPLTAVPFLWCYWFLAWKGKWEDGSSACRGIMWAGAGGGELQLIDVDDAFLFVVGESRAEDGKRRVEEAFRWHGWVDRSPSLAWRQGNCFFSMLSSMLCSGERAKGRK